MTTHATASPARRFVHAFHPVRPSAVPALHPMATTPLPGGSRRRGGDSLRRPAASSTSRPSTDHLTIPDAVRPVDRAAAVAASTATQSFHITTEPTDTWSQTFDLTAEAPTGPQPSGGTATAHLDKGDE